MKNPITVHLCILVLLLFNACKNTSPRPTSLSSSRSAPPNATLRLTTEEATLWAFKPDQILLGGLILDFDHLEEAIASMAFATNARIRVIHYHPELHEKILSVLELLAQRDITDYYYETIEGHYRFDHQIRKKRKPYFPKFVSTSLPTRLGYQSLDQLDRAPSYVTNLEPPYPYKMQQQQIEGTVWVRCYVDELGKVEHAEYYLASDQAFIEAAENALRQTTFQPATTDGVPTKFVAISPLQFTL